MSGGNGSGGPKVPDKDQLRAQLPKRFYKSVSVEAAGDGTASARVLLDGRPIRTPAKRALEVPTRVLAEAIADEWSAQGEVIDPSTMPITRIANSVIDAVAAEAEAVAADIAAFAACDLVCYRADAPEELVARQMVAWDGVVAWAERRLATRFLLAVGVTPVEQPDNVRANVLRSIEGVPPFRLAALHVVTTLTGSALLALALAERHMTADEVWSAAHVDEDWQIEQWGEDAEATARRTYRRSEFDAAAKILALT